MASRHSNASITKQTIPTGIRPMLCSLLHEPFQDPRYVYEIKWDGYRIISYRQGGTVTLESRGGQDYTKKYPSLVTALKALNHDVILDGEVVVLNEEGKPDFDALQRFNGQKSGVIYYVFDIIWMDGVDYTTHTLLDRKSLLEDIVSYSSVIRYSDHFEDGISLFDKVKSLGLEGMVAKRKSSVYLQDKRGKDWYKIPTAIKQEFVIGGWIKSESGRLFRTLLFGAFEDGKLKWIGHAGGGYKDHEMPEILKKLKKLEISKSPFSNEVDYDGEVHWVKPVLVANIKYATTTRSGKIRKPAIFLGFRNDKPSSEVINEKPAEQPPLTKDSDPNSSNWAIVEQEKISNRQTLEVGGYDVTLHNVDRKIWKGVTKGDLLQYYLSVSKLILPHLRDRPLSLYLKMNGPNAPGAYIKDMESKEPEWADIYRTPRLHKKTGKRDVIDYLVCNNNATLLYVINLGCIDVNPWSSRTTSPEHPDYIVIDLDPSDGDFGKALESARVAKELFDKHGLKAFIKTSGKTGLHMYIPCQNVHYHQCRAIAENMCSEINHVIPEITTTEVAINARENRLYLDPGQNDFTDTVAAVYSVRPSKHPTVSTPLDWKEIKKSFSPEDFNIHTLVQRVNKKGDLFAGVLDKKVAVKNSKGLRKFF